jgi:myosin heavy subunit
VSVADRFLPKLRNANSSRFGKFTRIFLGPEGDIRGSSLQVYLLEKSRVISQVRLRQYEWQQ